MIVLARVRAQGGGLVKGLQIACGMFHRRLRIQIRIKPGMGYACTTWGGQRATPVALLLSKRFRHDSSLLPCFPPWPAAGCD